MHGSTNITHELPQNCLDKMQTYFLFKISLLLTWLHFFTKYILEVDINTSHNMTHIQRSTWHGGHAMSTWPTYLTHVHWHLTNKIHKPLGFWGHRSHYNCICKYCVNSGICLFYEFLFVAKVVIIHRNIEKSGHHP